MRNQGNNTYRRTASAAAYIIYALIAALAAAALVLLYPVYRRYQKSRAELRAAQLREADAVGRVAELKQRNADLAASPAAAEKVAREKFNLCREGESVLTYPAPKPVRPPRLPEQ